jgi:SAM-dependent methyltransferase
MQDKGCSPTQKPQTALPLGTYTQRSQCRFCDTSVEPVFDIGNVPLAGGFLRTLDEEELTAERAYPLSLAFCPKCYLVLCPEVIDAERLYKRGYFYYSSQIPSLVKHFTAYAADMRTRFPDAQSVLEFGCNDGVFLRPLRAAGFDVMGVDPSAVVEKVVGEGYCVYNDFFTASLAERIVAGEQPAAASAALADGVEQQTNSGGNVDLVFTSNSFAHIDDMKSVIAAIKKVLAPGGTLCIEVHYLRAIIDELHFDFIYHDHMAYYSVSCLDAVARLFDMRLVDVTTTAMHGSSLRAFIRNGTGEEVSGDDGVAGAARVGALLAAENDLRDVDAFRNYAARVHTWRDEFQCVYRGLRAEGKTVFGYGCSGRATILCCYADIDVATVIDDAPSKQGVFTAKYHANVVSSHDALYSDTTAPPDVVVLLAWPYAEPILRAHAKYIENGGVFLVPLPTIQIVDKSHPYAAAASGGN